MRPHQLLLLFALLSVSLARAEAVATDGIERCLSANVDLRPASAGAHLYRIVFLNRCDSPRNFIWCADHPAASLPPGIACPRAQGAFGPSPESRHSIRVRKEFQWHLPPGARIRFHDCPGGELPTSEFSCAPPAPPTASRR
jgi:hypothetical protein